jgi:hypothetical protein
MVGVESVRLLVVYHNTVRVPRLRILRAADRILKCLLKGDDFSDDKCNC